MTAFDTKRVICGDWRHPRQMLGDQTYDGHMSIHDDKMAEDLGFFQVRRLKGQLILVNSHRCLRKFGDKYGLRKAVLAPII